MSTAPWSGREFQALIVRDQLEALGYLVDHWRAGTVDEKEALRLMLRENFLPELALMLVKRAVEHDPQKAEIALYELILAGVRLSKSAERPKEERVAALVRRVAEGTVLSGEERAELLSLISRTAG